MFDEGGFSSMMTQISTHNSQNGCSNAQEGVSLDVMMNNSERKMVLNELNAASLYAAIMQACYAVVAQRDNLNAINLFPVADGDTGDNMAATATAIIRYATIKPSIAETLQSIADAGIMGARGNSGMIFSQFFNGLLEKAPNSEHLNTQSFATILNYAAASVRAAILHPVEGTMLTMIETWARRVDALSVQYPCFNQLLLHTHLEIEQALQKTAHTIEVLEQANVVDAGALGFYHFIEAFTGQLDNPRPLPESIDEVLYCDAHEHEHELPAADEPPTYRYCTEAILTANDLDKHALAELLEQHGDCVVLTANQRMCRFHLHTSTPWQVFSTVKTHGKIEQPKVDDMLRQFEVLHRRKNSIALVVDSGADIPQSFIDAHQLHVIPINVFIDGHHLLDRFCVDNTSLYNSLADMKTYPTTSFPALTLIESKFRQLASQYEHVLVLSIAKALSGTHDAFVTAASVYDNVHVINTKQTAGGHGLLACHAAKLIADNQDIDTIVSSICDKVAKTSSFVAVEQFDSLIRSGRVGKLTGRIAQFSGIKPILGFDAEGKGFVYDKAFSSAKALTKMVHVIEGLAQSSAIESYCIFHAGVPEKAQQFAALTTEAFNHAPDFIECVSPGIGLHAGQGCVAIAVMLK